MKKSCQPRWLETLQHQRLIIGRLCEREVLNARRMLIAIGKPQTVFLHYLKHHALEQHVGKVQAYALVCAGILKPS
jgi:hypothetical protein